MVAYMYGTHAVLSVAPNTDPSTPSLPLTRSPMKETDRWERGGRREVEGQQDHHPRPPVYTWETPSTV